MPGINVPEGLRTGFQKLSALNDAEMQELLDAVRKQGPALLPRKWIAQISATATSISPSDVGVIVESALSMFSVRGYLSTSNEQFAQSIAESDDINVLSGRRPILARRIVDLLTTEALFVTSKALDITTEEAQTFHDARIITEVRPIFHDDATQPPAAVAIVHRLRISYHQGTDVKEFYVLLTENGSDRLRQALDRAKDKGIVLKALMDKLEMRVLGPDQE